MPEFKKITDYPKPNETESAYTGDYLYYEIVLRVYEEIGKEVRI